MVVGSGYYEAVAVDRQIAPQVLAHIAGQRPRVLPEQITGRGVESLHVIPVGCGEDHTIVLQRCRLVLTVRQRPCPGHTQIADVGPGDLFQRAEALSVISAPPVEPFARRRILQKLVGDHGEVIQRIGHHERMHCRRQRRQRHHGRRRHRTARQRHTCQRLGVRRQLSVRLVSAIDLDEIGHELCGGLRCQRSRARGWHPSLNEGEKILSRLATPIHTERVADEPARKLTTTQIHAVTTRTALRVSRLALRRLS